jgi:hypothetical protein
VRLDRRVRLTNLPVIGGNPVITLRAGPACYRFFPNLDLASA